MVNSLLGTVMFKLTQQSPRKTKATHNQKKKICGSQRTDVTDGADPVEKQPDGPRWARGLQRGPEREESRALEEKLAPFDKSSCG